MIGKDLEIAKQLLENGEVVAIPTETVYGLAGNALNPISVTKIFQIKERPRFDPLIVHTHSVEAMRPFLKEVPPRAEQLFEAFSPGALTILLPRSQRIPDLVTAGLERVAVRIPNHPLTLELLRQLDFPLAAPSANPFGYISPTSAEHVAAQLGKRIPYILDGGPAVVGIESTIVGFEEEKTVIYRKGGIPVEAIEAMIGPVDVRQTSSSSPAAPGMLRSHYAPTVPLELGDLEALQAARQGVQLGVLSFQRFVPGIPEAHQRVLSPAGDLAEAARGLFAAMRELDALPIELIIAELLPEEGLGRAINDRLRRAAMAAKN